MSFDPASCAHAFVRVVLPLALTSCVTGPRRSDIDRPDGAAPLPCLQDRCRREDLERALGGPHFVSVPDRIAMWRVAIVDGLQAVAWQPRSPLDGAETLIVECNADGEVCHWRLLAEPAPRPDFTVGTTTRVEVLFACGMPALEFEDGRELVYGVHESLWATSVDRQAYGPTDVAGLREHLVHFPFQQTDVVEPALLRFDAGGVLVEGWR